MGVVVVAATDTRGIPADGASARLSGSLVISASVGRKRATSKHVRVVAVAEAAVSVQKQIDGARPTTHPTVGAERTVDEHDRVVVVAVKLKPVGVHTDGACTGA